jgi:hypothetical protein
MKKKLTQEEIEKIRELKLKKLQDKRLIKK